MGAVLIHTAGTCARSAFARARPGSIVPTWSGASRFRPRLYAQDGWQATDRLRINAGLRWDALFFSSNGNPALTIPDQLAPRLGFVYQAGKAGTQKLSASYGRFYEEIPTNLFLNYFVPGSLTIIDYNHNPLVDPTGGHTTASIVNSGIPKVKRLRGQHFDEFTLGYERLLRGRTKLELRGMYRALREVVDDAPADGNLNDFIVGNPGRGSLKYTGLPRNEYSALQLVLDGSGERARVKAFEPGSVRRR